MYKIILIITGFLFLYGCGSKSSGLNRAEISGYDFKKFTDNSGPKPKVGEFAYFQMDIYDDKDSLLQTYRNQKILPSVKILDPTDKMRKKNPVVDVLSYLSVGDSAAIIVPVDSVPNMPPGYDLTHIEYHLTMSEILSEPEHELRMAQEREKAEAELEALQARLPEVEKLTAETLALYTSGKLEVQQTPGGVKYYIHELGKGGMPSQDNMLTWAYYGLTVADGHMFDNSFVRGRGYTFRLGRDSVIQGWHEAGSVLPVGTKASIFLPSELGYGEVGSPPDIPANAELYFYIEVEEMFY